MQHFAITDSSVLLLATLVSHFPSQMKNLLSLSKWIPLASIPHLTTYFNQPKHDFLNKLIQQRIAWNFCRFILLFERWRKIIFSYRTSWYGVMLVGAKKLKRRGRKALKMGVLITDQQISSCRGRMKHLYQIWKKLVTNVDFRPHLRLFYLCYISLYFIYFLKPLI